MKNNVLKVNNIFVSIQGESSLQGFPCVFVRLHGCNLNCSYCDTQLNEEDFTLMTAKQVYNKIMEIKPDTGFVCITGGEPLLQIKNMKWLLKKLSEEYLCVKIETNGSIIIPKWAQELDNVDYVMDIKMPSSGCKVNWNVIEKNIPIIANVQTEIKFVVSKHNDFFVALKYMERIKSLCDKYLYNEYCKSGLLDYYDEECHMYPVFYFSPVFDKPENSNKIAMFSNWIARQLVFRNIDAGIQLQLHKLIGVE